LGKLWDLIWRRRGDTYRTVIIAVLIALGVRTFLFEPFNIPSDSMNPTLLDGDYIFVSKFSYGYSRHSFPWSLPPFPGRVVVLEDPQRGDVAVFKEPRDNRTDFIKRVIGLPGETIEMRQGELYIDGEMVRRERAESQDTPLGHQAYVEYLPGAEPHTIWVRPNYNRVSVNNGTWQVPEGEYLMMGDNRDNSNDSRRIGTVPLENFVGRADIIFLSVNPEVGTFDIGNWDELIRWNRLGEIID